MSTKETRSKKGKIPPLPMETLEIGNALYTTRLTNKYKNRSIWERPDARKIVAVIPGTIQRIIVSEGDEVKAGTPLLILEAMKMRNEILAPMDGVIGKIHVTEGTHVPKSQLLVEMD